MQKLVPDLHNSSWLILDAIFSSYVSFKVGLFSAVVVFVGKELAYFINGNLKDKTSECCSGGFI